MRTSSGGGGAARSDAWPELVHLPEPRRSRSRESARRADPNVRKAVDFSTPSPKRRVDKKTIESELIESPFSVQRLDEGMNAFVFSPPSLANENASPSKLERMETMFAALCNHNRVMEANYIQLRNRLDVVQQHTAVCVRTELRSVKAEYAALRELTDFFVSSMRHDLENMSQAFAKYISATNRCGAAASSGGRVYGANSLSVSNSTIASAPRTTSSSVNFALPSAMSANASGKVTGDRAERGEHHRRGTHVTAKEHTGGTQQFRSGDRSLQHNLDMYSQYTVENTIPRDFQIALQHRSVGSDGSTMRSRTTTTVDDGDTNAHYEGGSMKDDAPMASEVAGEDEDEKDAIGTTPLGWGNAANHSSPFQRQRDLLLRAQEESKARRGKELASSTDADPGEGDDDSTPSVPLLRYHSKSRKPTTSVERHHAAHRPQDINQPDMPLSDTTMTMSFSSNSSSEPQYSEALPETAEEGNIASLEETVAMNKSELATHAVVPPSENFEISSVTTTENPKEAPSDRDPGAAYGDVVSLRGDVMQLRQGLVRMEERLESQKQTYERQLSAAHEVHKEREKTLQSQVDLLQRVVDANRARDADELTFLLAAKAGQKLKGASGLVEKQEKGSEGPPSRSLSALQSVTNGTNMQDALLLEQQHQMRLQELYSRSSPHGSNVASLEGVAKALLETTRDRKDASFDFTQTRSRGSSRPPQSSFGPKLTDICDTANQLLARHPVRWSPSRETSEQREYMRPSRPGQPSNAPSRTGAKRSSSTVGGQAHLTRSGDILRPPTQSDMTRVAQGLWAEEELLRRQQRKPPTSKAGKKNRQPTLDSHFYCL